MKIFKQAALLVNSRLLVGVLMMTAAAAQAQTLDAQPVFSNGDKWTYRFEDTGSRKEPYLYTNQTYKIDASSAWMYCQTQNLASVRKQYIVRFDYKSGDFKESFEVDPANPQFPGARYSQSLTEDVAVQFPLTVGKKYNLKWNYSNGSGYTEYSVEVAGYEKVKTEAGEFDAYRIMFDGWWTNTTGGHAHGKATMTQWFAPSAKRVVKIVSADLNSKGLAFNSATRELVKWEPTATLPAALVTPVTQ